MVGEYVRSLRSSAGLTQQELADRVGISASMLSLIESARREPTIRLLKDIARVLGIPSAALFAVALDDATDGDDSPLARKLRAANASLLAAAQQAIVLQRMQRLRDQR